MKCKPIVAEVEKIAQSGQFAYRIQEVLKLVVAEVKRQQLLQPCDPAGDLR
jgi:hypothetical protein